MLRPWSRGSRGADVDSAVWRAVPVERWSFRKDYQIVLGSPCARPICDVFLLGPRGKILQRVLVDTGADYSVFPLKAAEDAGLSLGGAVPAPIQYGGSSTEGSRMSVQIVMGSQSWQSPVVFVQRLPFPYGLLGRIGVFPRFREVAFQERRPNPAVAFRLR